MLFECLVVIFLIDESIPNSFEIIKNLTSIINENFPNLNLILVQNKREIKNIEIKENKINEYLNLYPYIINLKLSLKNKDEVSSILSVINKISNSKKMLSNFVFETNTYKIHNLTMTIFPIVGNSQAGKTSFFQRFRKKFDEYPYTTMSTDKEIRIFKIGEDIMRIALWDTPGQERFRTLSRNYYQKSDGIFLFFDVTNEETFNNSNWWVQQIKKNIKNDQIPIIYLIGNKIDSDNRVISKDVAEEYAKSHGMKYFEISCKYDINNFEVINLMLLEAYKRKNFNSFKILMNKFKIKIESDLVNNSFPLNKYINY